MLILLIKWITISIDTFNFLSITLLSDLKKRTHLWYSVTHVRKIMEKFKEAFHKDRHEDSVPCEGPEDHTQGSRTAAAPSSLRQYARCHYWFINLSSTNVRVFLSILIFQTNFRHCRPLMKYF